MQIPIHKTSNKIIEDKIIALVDQMIQVKKQELEAVTERDKDYLKQKSTNIDNQINALVYEMYGIKEQSEIDVIEKK